MLFSKLIRSSVLLNGKFSSVINFAIYIPILSVSLSNGLSIDPNLLLDFSNLVKISLWL